MSRKHLIRLCGQRKLLSDCADAQDNLSLHWPQISEGTFSHIAALLFVGWFILLLYEIAKA